MVGSIGSLEAISTIVIPTYERHECLHRCLSHLSAQFDGKGVSINILVLDGSSEECSAKNLKICEIHGVKHLNYDETYPPLKRFSEGVLSVETEYVSLLADDDLLMPDGYFEALKFLEGNKSYIGAHGQYVRMELVEGEEAKVEPLYEYGTSIDSQRAIERLFVYFANYYPLFYGVFRTPVLQHAYRELVFEEEELEGAFIEFLPSAVTLCYGPMKKVDGLYLARETGGPNYVPAEKWVYQEHFFRRYERFRRGLMRHYMDDVFSEEKRSEAIDIAFATFFGKVFSPDPMLKLLQRLSSG